ncbi:glycosyltransferase [Asaia sp. VD9]|uniref:glycosyltransferase n=1 Tax=Asaia sp. VD9 TaxID=3081235 RepID=UPI00301A8FCC
MIQGIERKKGLPQVVHVDVSVVLNVHREGDLIYPTLRSLEAAAENASANGIVCELIIVADNIDNISEKIIKEYTFVSFEKISYLQVDLRSLGLSRNAGVKEACGKYIATADADDLVSSNYLTALYNKISTNSESSIVFPEYYQAFGDRHYVYKMFPSQKTGIRRLFSEHTYVSRLMVSRSALLEEPYHDCSSHQVYAYEDYDLNLRAAARGFEFIIAEDTIVFYRQHQKSIMALLSKSARLSPPISHFFRPEQYMRLAKEDALGLIEPPHHVEYKKEYRSSYLITKFMQEANLIEPEINCAKLSSAEFFSNLGAPMKPGEVYFDICNKLRNRKYSDVFFLPFLTKGGAEKYIINFIAAANRDPSRSCLLILGQEFDADKSRFEVPADVEVLDLFPMLGAQHAHHILDITFRVIKTFAPNARLFFKCCAFCVDFIRAYHNALAEYALCYFYFCPSFYLSNGYLFEDGYEHRFLLEYADTFDLVVSDHSQNLIQLQSRIPSWSGRTFALYNYGVRGDRIPGPSSGKRLIWASRLDAQKRPDLLCRIATELEASGIDIEIHVYGESVLDSFCIDLFNAHPNISYRGPFSGLKSIPLNDGDAFIYTSLFDGMPNVVLEAAELNLPIITVDIGGVPELLNDDCAYIARNTPDDGQLAFRYVEKIQEYLQADQEVIDRKVTLLGKRFADKHALSIYRSKVQEIFGFLDLAAEKASH